MNLVLGIISSIVGGVIMLTQKDRQFEYVTHQAESNQVLIIGALFLCTGLILIGLWKVEKTIKDCSKKNDDLKPEEKKISAESENVFNGNTEVEYKTVEKNGITFLMNPEDKKYRCRFCKAIVNPALCGCPKCGKDF